MVSRFATTIHRAGVEKARKSGKEGTNHVIIRPKEGNVQAVVSILCCRRRYLYSLQAPVYLIHQGKTKELCWEGPEAFQGREPTSDSRAKRERVMRDPTHPLCTRRSPALAHPASPLLTVLVCSSGGAVGRALVQDLCSLVTFSFCAKTVQGGAKLSESRATSSFTKIPRSSLRTFANGDTLGSLCDADRHFSSRLKEYEASVSIVGSSLDAARSSRTPACVS